MRKVDKFIYIKVIRMYGKKYYKQSKMINNNLGKIIYNVLEKNVFGMLKMFKVQRMRIIVIRQ